MEDMEKQSFLRRLPGVDRVMQEDIIKSGAELYPRNLLVEAVQEIIEETREKIFKAGSVEEINEAYFSPPAVAEKSLKRVREKVDHNLKRVINATGILLHTNLGRAPLPKSAVEALTKVSGSFCNLEVSLQTGKRSSRNEHVEELICKLSGAESAVVVNNNAAAVFLALNSLASGKEVVVSRGEQVEIGGSFRLPEVMAQSGAYMAEVGTTNKCYLKDYERAIGENTALFLKVHTSNYKIKGFTASVKPDLLVNLAHKYNLLVMEDLGSGMMLDLSSKGLPHEPTIRESISAGVDLVTFSGDKLLGGPQAGIIAGKKKYIDIIKNNQLLRALRVEKMVLSALEATLRLYFDEERAWKEIPVLNMLTLSADELKHRAQNLREQLEQKIPGENYVIGISREKAVVGGGSLPLVSLPSYQLSLEAKDMKARILSEKLRMVELPVLTRVKKRRVLVDLRSVAEEDDETLLEMLSRCLREQD